MLNSSKENIIESSKIYGRGSDRVLTSYEIAINEAAGKIALDDPALLIKRDVLYEKAKETVRCDTSFSFKKGKSRSSLTTQPTLSAKRKSYTDESSREEHITKLVQDIDGKQKQVKFKTLHQTKAQASKDWEVCEKLQSDINVLRKEIHSLQELKVFQRKQQKSKWYKKKGNSTCTSTKECQGNQSTLFQSIDKLKDKGKSTNTENEEGSGKETVDCQNQETMYSQGNNNTSENSEVEEVCNNSSGQDFL